MADPIQVKFEKYNRDHPKVYEYFKRFAFEAIAAGQKEFSSDAILHRIRWFVTIEQSPYEDYKINNNYSSRYARKFIEDFPQHAGFFKTRKLKKEISDPWTLT